MLRHDVAWETVCVTDYCRVQVDTTRTVLLREVADPTASLCCTALTTGLLAAQASRVAPGPPPVIIAEKRKLSGLLFLSGIQSAVCV